MSKLIVTRSSQRVDLVRHSCDSLVLFLEEMLPHHAHSIHALSIGRKGGNELFGSCAPENGISAAQSQTWEARREWEEHQVHQDALKQARKRTLLVAATEMVPKLGLQADTVQMHQIKDISLASALCGVISLQGVKIAALPHTQAQFTCALHVLHEVVATSPLHNLVFAISEGLQSHLSSLPCLLLSAPQLSVLTIHFPWLYPVPPSSHQQIAIGVKQLRVLETLTLRHCHPAFLSLSPLPATVKRLSLSMYGTITFDQLQQLFVSCSRSLEYLSLEGISVHAKLKETLDLPSLKYPVLGIGCEVNTSDVFVNARLQHLKVDTLQILALRNLLPLLTSLDKTLLTLHCQDTTLITSEDDYDDVKDSVERVWNWCAAHGVKATLPQIEHEEVERINYDSGDESSGSMYESEDEGRGWQSYGWR
ncbi:hypothetical protein JCM11641_003203 [Rhodosporidiobolus odoratus]